jgi:arabinogalactan oligomer/maltooligosaccharide transport system permease protein
VNEMRVVVWHSYRGDEERALAEVASAFEASSQVQVELLAIPFDAYAAKLASAIPSGHGPHLFIDAHERLGSYVEQGLVVPADAAGDPAQFDPVSVDAITLRGHRYGVPLANKCLALYVNEALLPGKVSSIEQLSMLRFELPSGIYPLAYEATSAYFHAPFLHAFGGRLIDGGDHFAFSSPASADALAFVRNLVVTKTIPEEPSGALVKDLFASGHAAAVISGPWLAGDLDARVKYRIEPLPDVQAVPLQPFLTVEAAFFTPTGAADAHARDFAVWLASGPSAKTRAMVGHQVVATAETWKDAEVAGDASLMAFHAAVGRSIPMPTSVSMRLAWEPANRAIQKVLRGDAEPANALREASRRFEDITRPSLPAVSPTPLLFVSAVVALVVSAAVAKRLRNRSFLRELRASFTAYVYAGMAGIAVFLLVILPLLASALISLFAGTRDAPIYVGLSQYVAILDKVGLAFRPGSFYFTLLVTVVWTVANVLLHVAIGLTLALVLSRPSMRFRSLYRVLLLLPWAVPSYVSALAWKGMFHKQFGAINAVLAYFGHEPVAWFSHFATSLAANITTNVWLGFPFMMVVILGALTSIPHEVLEAAEVDGASAWQRLRWIKLPLLGPAVLPAIILGAAWTFNMFNVVFLVSGGEPDGTTDILVTEAYRWAFTRNSQYGYAAAYSVIIFAILATFAGVLGMARRDRAPAW